MPCRSSHGQACGEQFFGLCSSVTSVTTLPRIQDHDVQQRDNKTDRKKPYEQRLRLAGEVANK
jgi:hypothetical protein